MLIRTPPTSAHQPATCTLSGPPKKKRCSTPVDIEPINFDKKFKRWPEVKQVIILDEASNEGKGSVNIYPRQGASINAGEIPDYVSYPPPPSHMATSRVTNKKVITLPVSLMRGKVRTLTLELDRWVHTDCLIKLYIFLLPRDQDVKGAPCLPLSDSEVDRPTPIKLDMKVDASEQPPFSDRKAEPRSDPIEEQQLRDAVRESLVTTAVSTIGTSSGGHPSMSTSNTNNPVCGQDNRDTKLLKSKAMEALIKTFFHERKNRGGGNCLPLSFSQAIYGDQEHDQIIRTQMYDEMRRDLERYGEFVIGAADGAARYADTVTIVDGEWCDQIDIILYSYVIKRVVIVIDTSGHYDKPLYHPKDPEDSDDSDIWNRVDRYALPIFLVRKDQRHYMLLVPNRHRWGKQMHIFFVKVSERIYLEECNDDARKQMFLKEGAEFDERLGRFYVLRTQLWRPFWKEFGAGDFKEIQKAELERRVSVWEGELAKLAKISKPTPTPKQNTTADVDTSMYDDPEFDEALGDFNFIDEVSAIPISLALLTIPNNVDHSNCDILFKCRCHQRRMRPMKARWDLGAKTVA